MDERSPLRREEARRSHTESVRECLCSLADDEEAQMTMRGETPMMRRRRKMKESPLRKSLHVRMKPGGSLGPCGEVTDLGDAEWYWGASAAADKWTRPTSCCGTCWPGCPCPSCFPRKSCQMETSLKKNCWKKRCYLHGRCFRHRVWCCCCWCQCWSCRSPTPLLRQQRRHCCCCC